MVCHVTVDEMLNNGLTYFGLDVDEYKLTKKASIFQSIYGVNAATCVNIFRDIQVVDIGEAKVKNVKLRYFLMCLYWLHRYQTEECIAVTFKIKSLVTVRKHLWDYAKAIQALAPQKIIWPFHHSYTVPEFVLSVDGTHCPILEPRKDGFDSDYFSHKLNGPGLAYEIGLHLHESKLLWIGGPYPAGDSDLVIFRKPNGLKSKLLGGMIIVADMGYQNEEQINVRNELDSNEVKQFKSRARARHESFNEKIKCFKVLSERYRHSIDIHRIVFESVCVIVQYAMDNNQNNLFDIL